jgi:hypothetical protein
LLLSLKMQIYQIVVYNFLLQFYDVLVFLRCRAKKSSIEWKLAERQLTIKSHESLGWFIEIKELCLKYDILNIYNYLENPLSKNQWKKVITTKIYTYWKSRLLEEAKLYKSLKSNFSHTIRK